MKNSHQDHEMIIIEGPFGIHRAKLVCKVCNKFIMWLPKNYQKILEK